MAWNANIPLSTDQLSQSQLDLWNNFQALNQIVTLAPNAVGTQYPRDTVVPTTAATTIALYGSDSLDTPGTTALFFRNQNNGASVDFTSSGKVIPGWCRLPSGVELRWGAFTLNSGNANGVCNYTKVFPTATLHIAITLRSAPTGSFDGRDYLLSAAVADFTANSFTVRRNTGYTAAPVDFAFIAIGY